MGDGHVLKPQTIDPEHTFWELAKSGQATSPFEKAISSGKNKEEIINLVHQIKKIQDSGVEASCKTGKLRTINQVPGLYEIKGYSGAKREMAFVLCRKPPEIVLLFRFVGHRGSGNISKEIDRAKPLVRIASDLLAKKLANKEREKGAENGPVAVHEGKRNPRYEGV